MFVVGALPALLAWQMFAGLRRLPGWKMPALRGGFVACAVLLWVLSLVYGLLGFSAAFDQACWPIHVGIMAAAAALAGFSARATRRLSMAPEFPLGLLVGETAVLATVFLHCLTLVWGGTSDWRPLIVLTLTPHLFIAAVEGVVLGFTVGFLARIKPALLRGAAAWEKNECAADPVP